MRRGVCAMSEQPSSIPLVDAHGRPVRLRDRVRVLSLSGPWLDTLTDLEKTRVLSMVGQVFPVEDIDQHGHPWVSLSGYDAARGRGKGRGRYWSHSVALMPSEMEWVLTPGG